MWSPCKGLVLSLTWPAFPRASTDGDSLGSLDLAGLLLTPGLSGANEYGKIGCVCVTKKQRQCIAHPKRVPSQPLVTAGHCSHLWRFSWLALNSSLAPRAKKHHFFRVLSYSTGSGGGRETSEQAPRLQNRFDSKTQVLKSRHRHALSSLGPRRHMLVPAIFKDVLKQQEPGNQTAVFKSPLDSRWCQRWQRLPFYYG